MPENVIAAAVVAVGLVIAAMFGRYDIRADGLTVYRIDRFTGHVDICGIPRESWCINSN
jgi:hypothetical protein